MRSAPRNIAAAYVSIVLGVSNASGIIGNLVAAQISGDVRTTFVVGAAVAVCALASLPLFGADARPPPPPTRARAGPLAPRAPPTAFSSTRCGAAGAGAGAGDAAGTGDAAGGGGGGARPTAPPAGPQEWGGGDVQLVTNPLLAAAR